eukprot:TRINITY_DN3083_c0_g4_i2.p1 TRINITY_DN3083_c0_g4~~TRINITY_DN3083_c0_g4_i2.p1  ORF type:complete len:371 (+),score=102.81 TRINITY_DN3083_c0_g4_i2:131-1114(+)
MASAGDVAVSFSELDALVELVARRLTQRYTEQLKALDSDLNGPQVVGQYAALMTFSMLIDDAVVILEDSSLAETAEALVSAIGTAGEKSIAERLWAKGKAQVVPNASVAQFFGDPLRVARKKVAGQQPPAWFCPAILTKAGIRTADGTAFSGAAVQPDLYGWRWGTTEEAAQLKLARDDRNKGQATEIKFSGSVGKVVRDVKETQASNSAQVELLQKQLQHEKAQREAMARKQQEMEERITRLGEVTRPAQGAASATAGATELEDLDVDGVVGLLKKWGLDEYEAKFRDHNMKGAKLMSYVDDDDTLQEIISRKADRQMLRRKLGRS